MEVQGYDESPETVIAKKIKHTECTSTPCKSSASQSRTSADHNASSSDLSCQNDGYDDSNNVGEDAEECVDDGDDNELYDFGEDAEEDNDYEDGDEDEDDCYYPDDDDDYLKLQSQFDNVDLPPGVEASVSWLPDPVPDENGGTVASSADTGNASSSKPAAESNKKKEEWHMNDALRKLMYFKNFDTVDDVSDHHYKSNSKNEPPKSWAKKIQDEWRILEENLPETIFVRVYESRMDLLRAAIIGPDGTPYHDGLFFFDAVFPASYPHEPPNVYYHSGGLRLNPNLYNCGKVCLSLLGTWSGNGSEKWIPNKSTMLQVLVSIQALILNAEPYYNEPGYEMYKGSSDGDRLSYEYTENAFLLSLKTMTYILRKPPLHFEDLVKGHFRLRANDIMNACIAYSEGAKIGIDLKKRQADDGDEAGDANDENVNGTQTFRTSLIGMIKGVCQTFIRNGASECEKYLNQ